MPNERNTENIVRNHFSKFLNEICIEEQKSENTKINKLLKNASKKGTKHGLPEFLITYKDNPDLIIVIECKADIKKHQSIDLDNYAEYAVDGVLLYSSFLAKEYDVISIAVSGENSNELKISHFLQLKGSSKATPIFSDVLLSAKNYLDEYIKSDEKFRQDYKSLLVYAKSLNKELHSKKVKENQRSLLISGILIGLGNEAFKISYKQHKHPKDLANSLTQAIYTEFYNAAIGDHKLDMLKAEYGFINVHPSLSGEDNVLSYFVESIDLNVNRFIKTYKYYDILSQFYVEFLRYSNSDKGLGIVLTPPHITELFSRLAQINKDSIVYDNCTGTGGFLISSMNLMIKDAKGDTDKIKHIKKNQLIGAEYQNDIFALVCSNMFIHEDGKTNIIYGNCFNKETIESAKQHKPNVGLLNPPYPKHDSDPLELDFVLNNLQVLEPNSPCIAIIPISSVLGNSGRDYELKEKLFHSHTLEAVLSMPDQLFYNSNVGVVSVIIIFTAHKPHPKGKKTWFGYFKKDGFKVMKHKGRNDFSLQWDKIKEQWIDIFINRTIIKELSIAKEVSAKDEWCAEAYLETDYNLLSENDFVRELKKYAAYNILINQ